MRILMITQWFEPEPTFKGLAFARALQGLGNEVEVLTGFPNYPSGHLYDGYRISTYMREEMEGIPIHRAPLYPSHDNSALHRTVNYLSFALGATTIGATLRSKFDVAYVYHPPGTIGLPAVVLSLVRPMRYVYDVQDLWPESLATTGMVQSPLILALVRQALRVTYSRATAIVVLSPGMKRKLAERGVPPEKIEVIMNWCHETDIATTARDDESTAKKLGLLPGKFNVVYAGNIGRAQALDTVLETASRLTASDVQFVLVGDGTDAARLRDIAAKRGLENVRFIPHQPMNEIGRILNLANVLLVHLKDDPIFSFTIPSKTQAYLFAGKPVIIGVRGDAADLVERASAGERISPESPEELVGAIRKLQAMSESERIAMGQRGREFYARELSMRSAVSRFNQLFQRVVNQS